MFLKVLNESPVDLSLRSRRSRRSRVGVAPRLRQADRAGGEAGHGVQLTKLEGGGGERGRVGRGGGGSHRHGLRHNLSTGMAYRRESYSGPVWPVKLTVLSRSSCLGEVLSLSLRLEMICQAGHQSRHAARAGAGVVGRLTETVLGWARALGGRTAHWPGGCGGHGGGQWRGSTDCRHRAGAGAHLESPTSHSSIAGVDVPTTATALLCRDLAVVRLATVIQFTN